MLGADRKHADMKMWGMELCFVTLLELYKEQTQIMVSAWVVYRFVYTGYQIKKNSISVRSLKYCSNAVGLPAVCPCLSFILLCDCKPSNVCCTNVGHKVPNLLLYQVF